MFIHVSWSDIKKYTCCNWLAQKCLVSTPYVLVECIVNCDWGRLEDHDEYYTVYLNTGYCAIIYCSWFQHVFAGISEEFCLMFLEYVYMITLFLLSCNENLNCVWKNWPHYSCIWFVSLLCNFDKGIHKV